jgi:hypothetical protein
VAVQQGGETACERKCIAGPPRRDVVAVFDDEGRRIVVERASLREHDRSVLELRGIVERGAHLVLDGSADGCTPPRSVAKVIT